VPIDTARDVIKAILDSAKDGTKGHVDRSDLGVDLKPLQDLETFYDIDINKGVLVNSVDRGSPADKAGVKTQDILLEINGKPINVRFPEEVAPARRIIANLPIGQDIDLLIKRGKENMHLTAKTRKLEGAVGEEREFKKWGVSVREVTPAYANAQQLDDADGGVVTTLSPGYPAAKAEMGPGDIIRSVNGNKVEDLEEFQKIYDDSIKAREASILIELRRGRGTKRALLKMEY
jgi:serine protease Do